ncbi:hypothetical protein BN1708_019966, partial [Verticillium longisporum]
VEAPDADAVAWLRHVHGPLPQA